ncbi:MAG: hypothetical protein DSY82_07470 [Flavobacteriia bacterium]|nr:MAG: hypothetical protein DSY82_07470 [Flavobacteriia bacterium]
MKIIKYNFWLILILLSIKAQTQEYEKPLQEFNVKRGATIKIEASYQEIEIEEWNKNKVSIQGIFQAEGLSKNKARSIFDQWNINSLKEGNTVEITSKSNGFGDSYYFLNNNKFLGPLYFEIDDLDHNTWIEMDTLFFMPSIEYFPNYDFEFDFGADTITFDFERFQNDMNYMKEWQEKNKAHFKKIEEQLKNNKDLQKAIGEQNALQAAKMAEMSEIQAEKMARLNEERAKKLAKVNAERAEKMARLNEKRAELAKKRAKELEKRSKKQHEIMLLRKQKLNEVMIKRNKIKVKKILRIRVPKGAKLEMDVDNCRIVNKR